MEVAEVIEKPANGSLTKVSHGCVFEVKVLQDMDERRGFKYDYAAARHGNGNSGTSE
jgi:hypothetical protein